MPRSSPHDTTEAAAHDAADSRTPTTAVLRPILIRSLSRQRALVDGKVVDQVSTPPPAPRTPTRGRLRRVLEIPPHPAAGEGAAPQAQAAAGKGMERNARRKKTVKGAATTYIMELSSFPAKEQPVRRSKVVTYSDLEVDKPGHIMDDALRADVHESSGATTPLKGQHSKSSMIQERDDDDQHLRCQCFERMLTKYAEALETRPLIYKCMTSALVGGLGDVVAQALSWVFRGGVSRTIWHDIKAMRQTLAVAVDGFCVNAPFLHFAYAVLDRWLPAQESTAFALAQVLVDIFILSPLYALSFIVTTGLLEGKSVDKEILRTVRDDYPPLVFWLVVVGLILAPLHIYLFNRFSLKWRVLISDGIDLLWTVIACFVIEPT